MIKEVIYRWIEQPDTCSELRLVQSVSEHREHAIALGWSTPHPLSWLRRNDTVTYVFEDGTEIQEKTLWGTLEKYVNSFIDKAQDLIG